MSEEDTFKKLKGMTKDEAFAIYKDIYDSCYGGIAAPYQIYNLIDAKLRPHGWSVSKLKEHHAIVLRHGIY